ncbi:hypothetical protein ACSBR1_032068 [Camellia fascicularis]
MSDEPITIESNNNPNPHNQRTFTITCALSPTDLCSQDIRHVAPEKRGFSKRISIGMFDSGYRWCEEVEMGWDQQLGSLLAHPIASSVRLS